MGTLIVLAMFFKYIGWVALILGLAALVYLLVRFAKRYVARRDTQEAELERIRARADVEAAQWNNAGIYEGGYPAATMPLPYVPYLFGGYRDE